MSGQTFPTAPVPLPDEVGARLALRLFGPMEVRVAAQPLRRLHSRKGLWLLALLALRAGRDVERDWLASVLWLDSDAPTGRRNLRQSLSDLRLALGREASRLNAEGSRTLRLDTEGAFVDAIAFDAALFRGDPESLAAAVSLYRGPLLEDCAEEWCLRERQQREQAYLGALASLAANATARAAPSEAAAYLRLAVGADPFREDLQRSQMEALAAAGNPTAALLAYRQYRELLRSQMGAEPAEETAALFRRLREETRAGAKPRSGEQGTAVAPQSLVSSFPVSRALPAPLTELIGREAAVQEVTELLARPPTAGGCRLLTLMGTGGIGKTRLALQVARELEDHFSDGACFVELASLSDGALVAPTVAAALGVAEPADRPAGEGLREALRGRDLLLTLDNCEHLAQGCAELADGLLRHCAGVRILATSRQPLGLVGEVAWRVPSLEVPGSPALPAGVKDGVSYFLEYDAVRLFVTRAQQADRGFRLTSRDAATIAQICRRLDGIPLAIELAAARVRAMPVETIAARLDDRFRLLCGGSSTALPRHQTLRAALDWSHDLLPDPERRLLRRLSVFVGGWTLEAAEAVCEDEGGRMKAEGPNAECPTPNASLHPSSFILLRSEAVLDLLTSLVDRSLVAYDGWGGEGRYRFFETVRQYAGERLEEAGEREFVQRRHLEFFLTLAEAAEPHLTGSRQTEWLERLETEHDNLRAALDWSLSLVDGLGAPTIHHQPATVNPREAGLRLTAALWRFWMVRGHLTEGRERLRQALAGPAASTTARAKALHAAGSLAYRQADYQAARSLAEESLGIRRELWDRSGISDSLNNIGTIAYAQEDYPAARSFYQESLAIRRELGDRSGIAASLNNLGAIAYGQQDYGGAGLLYEESLAVYRELEDLSSIATSLNNLGMVAWSQQDLGAARSLYEESLAIRRQVGDRLGIAASLHLLGNIAVAEKDYARARSLYEEGLAIRRDLSDRWGIAGLLEQMAKLECDVCGVPSQHASGGAGGKSPEGTASGGSADARRAVRLFGAADALREAIGTPLAPGEQEAHRRHLSQVRELLEEDGVASAWAEGRAMTVDQAVAEALRGRTI